MLSEVSRRYHTIHTYCRIHRNALIQNNLARIIVLQIASSTSSYYDLSRKSSFIDLIILSASFITIAASAMVLHLPIPNKQADVCSSHVDPNFRSNSTHSYNRDISATPVISNLASGVYPIGTSEVQRPILSSININFQQQLQQ